MKFDLPNNNSDTTLNTPGYMGEIDTSKLCDHVNGQKDLRVLTNDKDFANIEKYSDDFSSKRTLDDIFVKKVLDNDLFKKRQELLNLKEQNKKFICVKIPGYVIDDACLQKAYTYFPADGEQPNDKQAPLFSCANLENHPFDPVTKWYMQMFGYSADENGQESTPLKMGFNAQQKPNPILATYSRSAEMMQKEGMSEQDIEYSNKAANYIKDSFWCIFRIIAATPPGRILLYRLLIEIHRTKDGAGAAENDTYTPTLKNKKHRDGIRSLAIDRTANNSYIWEYFGDESKISLNICPLARFSTQIKKQTTANIIQTVELYLLIRFSSMNCSIGTTICGIQTGAQRRVAKGFA